MARHLIGASSATEFGLDISRGIYANASHVNKFGMNPSMDSGDPATDIWEFGASQPSYLFPDWGTAPIDKLSSSNLSDTMLIKVEGLDVDGKYVSQNVQLLGNLPASLTTPLWRVFRMSNASENLATGKGVDIIGTIYCFEDSSVTVGTPDDDTKVHAVIVDGNNQTQMGIFTIPKGMTGYFINGGAGIAKEGVGGSSAVLELRVRTFGGVLRIQKTVAASSNGASHFVEQRGVYDKFEELTDIVLTCSEVSTNGTAVWGSIELILIDENLEQGKPSEA